MREDYFHAAREMKIVLASERIEIFVNTRVLGVVSGEEGQKMTSWVRSDWASGCLGSDGRNEQDPVDLTRGKCADGSTIERYDASME